MSVRETSNGAISGPCRDPAVSYWLRDALAALACRDCALPVALMRERADEALRHSSSGPGTGPDTGPGTGTGPDRARHHGRRDE